MSNRIFIIPGFHDSGPSHWQSWLQARLPQTQRLQGVDWEHPDLTSWADQAHTQLAQSAQPALFVAHSFGCLVAATLAAEQPRLCAGIVFVAPADPRRFALGGGLRNTRHDTTAHPARSVAEILPETLPASISSAVLASENDPWLAFKDAASMAQRWRSHLVNLGEAGHVNTESGYGPWPGLLRHLLHLQQEGTPDFTRLSAQGLERYVPVPDESGDGYHAMWLRHQRSNRLPRFAL